MSIPGAASPLFLGAAVAEEAAYQIDRSLRFNDGDSAHLSKTFSSAGNRKTWTWSAWVKVCSTGTGGFALFGASGANTGSPWNFATTIRLRNNKISFTNHANDIYLTDAVFRDNSAWYHIVVALDTTDSTTANRVKIYVNGELQDKTHQGHSGAAEPTQNLEYAINTTDPHKLGATSDPSGTAYSFWDGYIADVHFIDGQALAPTDFGEYDSNNVWQPKEFAGTYGTNGFHLDFSDASSNSALGEDSSGNNNDWTVNNISASTVNYSSGGNDSSLTNYSFRDLFDKSLTTGAYLSVGGSGSTVRYTFPSAISGSIRFYGSTGAGAANNTANCATITLSTGQTFDFGPYTSSNPAWSTTWTVSNLQYVDLFGQNIPGNSDGLWLRAIELDGVLLTDSFLTDSLIDTPTNYSASSGNNGGNYCTWNPLEAGSGFALSNGNLDASVSSGWRSALGTFAIDAGKWYYEFKLSAVTAQVGICGSGTSRLGTYIQTDATAYVVQTNTGTFYTGSSGSVSSGFTWSAGDIVQIAYDGTNNKIWVGKNNSWYGDPSAGTGEISSSAGPGSTGRAMLPVVSLDTGASGVVNFGQRPFAYTPPTGFLPLVTTSLSDPTIADGSTAMDVVTYTGNGTSQTVSGLNLASSPDLIIIKSRTGTNKYFTVADSVRGIGSNSAYLRLFTNETLAEADDGYDITGITSDGFSVTNGSYSNASSEGYVAWAWDGGTTTATNTDGSITSNVRANASAGFSIVTWTGTTNATVGHGLNAAPALVITKSRNNAVAWRIWSSEFSNAASDFLGFDTNAVATFPGAYWGSITSTTLGFKSNTYDNNKGNMVAYCFAPVAGYSAFGSFTGNGSADGPFIYLGFRPKLFIYKRTDAATDWWIFDSSRDTYNVIDGALFPNKSDAELATNFFDFTSNGAKLRDRTDTNTNANGGTYIWAAWAEHPFKTARAR